jgi:hypothetical protein
VVIDGSGPLPDAAMRPFQSMVDATSEPGSYIMHATVEDYPSVALASRYQISNFVGVSVPRQLGCLFGAPDFNTSRILLRAQVRVSTAQLAECSSEEETLLWGFRPTFPLLPKLNTLGLTRRGAEGTRPDPWSDSLLSNVLVFQVGEQRSAAQSAQQYS